MQEFVQHKINCNYNVCRTCLSGDRRLFTVNKYRDIFKKICGQLKLPLKPKLCWECIAVLRKIKKFQENVKLSQKLLLQHKRNKEKALPKSLSQLEVTKQIINATYYEIAGDELLDIVIKDESFIPVSYQKTEYDKVINAQNVIEAQEVLGIKDYCSVINNVCSDNENDELTEQIVKFKTSDDSENDWPNNEPQSNVNINVLQTQEEGELDAKDNCLVNNNVCSRNEKDKFTGLVVKLERADSLDCDWPNNKPHSDVNIKEHKSDNDIKKEKKEVGGRRSKLYKFLFGKMLSSDMDQLSIKIPVQLSESKALLDKERESEEFKLLEYKCELCVSSWGNKNRVVQHNKKFHDIRSQYQCDVCSKRFAEKKHLSAHTLCHLYLWECRTCKFRGSTSATQRHLATHGRLVQCRECDAKFTNVRLFYKHHKLLHEVFICDHCGKVCKSKHVLAKHIAYNHVPYKCTICDTVYKRRAGYLQHRNAKHSVSRGDDAYCVACDKRFYNAHMYRSHLKYSGAHARERRGGRQETKIKCPDCDKVYSRTTYMMNHYRYVHMKKSNYHCVECDQYFLNSTKYKEHKMFQHEGATKVKNKLCGICGRGFAAKTTLINHIRTHSGERPFECEHCGAKFAQKYAMQSHVNRIHLKSRKKLGWQ